MYRLEFLPSARQDLIDTVRYITEKLKNPDAADRIAEEIVAAAESLREFPYRNPVFRPMKPLEREVRSVPAGNYLLFYWVEEEEKRVTIARILYARRDLEAALARPD